MLSQSPFYISALFIATTLLTLVLFFRAMPHNRNIALGVIIWMLVQGAIAYTGFYLKTDALPPRFILAVAPPLLTIIAVFSCARGRRWMDRLAPKALTLVHVVRIPVEFILYALFLGGSIPELMTFAGRNFDILAGITAPLVYYFGFMRKTLSPGMTLAWNIVCILLLLNIVFHGILSAPSPVQQFAFDQPNIALLHFPFSWLPAVIVPIVLFSHLVEIRRLAMRG